MSSSSAGRRDDAVVFRAAAGLVDAGLITLRFNFRGVGASTGEHSEIPGGIEDVETVIDHMTSEYPDTDLTLAGFSFGSRTAMETGIDDPSVARLISIGTPVDKYQDYDFLLKLKKPILFIHGDSDEFGALDNLKRLVDGVAKVTDTELVTFTNCGHFFDEHLDQLRAAVKDWVIKRSIPNRTYKLYRTYMSYRSKDQKYERRNQRRRHSPDDDAA